MNYKIIGLEEELIKISNYDWNGDNPVFNHKGFALIIPDGKGNLYFNPEDGVVFDKKSQIYKYADLNSISLVELQRKFSKFRSWPGVLGLSIVAAPVISVFIGKMASIAVYSISIIFSLAVIVVAVESNKGLEKFRTLWSEYHKNR